MGARRFEKWGWFACFGIATFLGWPSLLPAEPKDKIFDASGEQNLPPAQPGQSYEGHSPLDGAPGRHGGNASEAFRAQRPGSVRFHLRGERKGGTSEVRALRINGTLILADGSTHVIEEEMVVGDNGRLYLIARGGKGGDGGRGGDGEGGGHGRPGANATRARNAGSGGSGGPGGDAGAGSSGADGQDGGSILVEVPADQTSLLMLVKTDVAGGEGGAPGESNGRPGAGGDAGPGGLGLDWEEEYRDGNATTKRRRHRSPGAPGEPGVPGRPSSARLTRGQAGQPGKIQIDVRNADGSVSSYHSVYDLELVGKPEIVDDGDGILEPGETCYVSRITVKNRGGMPTPAGQEIWIALQAHDFVVPQPMQLHLERTLQPGESVTLEGKLPFTIPEFQSGRGGLPQKAKGEIALSAVMTSVGEPFTGFQAEPLPIQISLPIELVSLETLPAIAPGGATKVRLTVRNRSERQLGSAAKLKREVKTALLGNPNAEESGFVLRDTQGNEYRFSDGLFQAIEKLPKKETTVVEAIVSVKPDAKAYAQLELGAQLFLSAVGSPELRLRQTASARIQVAEPYENGPADVLLVANRDSTAEEVQAWKDFALKLGLRAKVWNLSTNSGLDLTQALSNGSTLMQDLHGGLVVVLNNAFEPAPGEGKINPDLFVKEQQFLTASSQHDIRFLLVGENGASAEGKLLWPYLMPTQTATEARYRSEAELLAARAAQAREMVSRNLPYSAGDPTAHLELVEMRSLRWRAPRESQLHAKVQGLASRLEALFPQQRDFTVCRFETPTAVGKRDFLGRRCWDYGAIELRRTLDTAQGGMVALRLESSQMHSADVLDRADTQLAFLLALSFDKKLELLSRFGRSDADGQPGLDAGNRLVDAILADIVGQQTALLKRRWLSGWQPGAWAVDFKHLVALTKMEWPQVVSLADLSGKLAVRLAAGIEFAARAQVGWLDYLPWRRALAVEQAMLEGVRAWLARIIAAKDQAAVKQAIWERQRELKRLAKQTEGSDRKARSRELLLQPLREAGIESDAEVFLSADERTFEAASYEQALAIEKQRSAAREALLARLQERAQRLGCRGQLAGE